MSNQTKITSATFIKGVVNADEALEGDIPQIAFIGRSNVGKSSVINSVTGQKGLARSSATPGFTKEINLFLINKSIYLLDLPGYGYIKASRDDSIRLKELIYWYLFDSGYEQKKVVLIIDAEIGPTKNDMEVLHSLEERGKEIVVVANKVDKIKASKLASQLAEIQKTMGGHKLVPYSAEKGIGIKDLTAEILDLET